MASKYKDVNGFHQQNNFNSFDYQSYMMKSPYDIYYNQNFIDSMKAQGLSMDAMNSQIYYNRMNSKKILTS
jgi:hypothetical protein